MTLVPTEPLLERTEPELTAEILWVLIATRCVQRDREWLARACQTLGVTPDDVGRAMQRLGENPTREWVKPRPAVILALELATAPAPTAAPPLELPRTSVPREPTKGPELPPEPAPLKRSPTRQREERGDELWCRRHDDGQGAWVHKRDFSLRSDRPGHYRAWCDACTATYNRAKYLSVETLNALHHEGIRVGDLPEAARELVKDPCGVCREVFGEDDVVVASVRVVHKGCGGA